MNINGQKSQHHKLKVSREHILEQGLCVCLSQKWLGTKKLQEEVLNNISVKEVVDAFPGAFIAFSDGV